MNRLKKIPVTIPVSLITAMLLFCLSSVGFSATKTSLSPVGTWTTISDKTKKPRSVVRIWKSKGILYGKILKVYKQPGDTGYCQNCPGRFKGKPVKGLTILWGLRQTAANKWSGGKVIDPKIGKIYRATITIAPNGKSLKIRGYVGFAMLGRTQTWVRR